MEFILALRKVDGRSPGCTESWQKSTDGLLAAWDIDRIWHKVFWLHQKLTEFLQAAQKVDRSWQRLPAAWKVDWSWQKISRQHGKLTKVDERSPSRTKFDRNRRKFFRLHGKLTEFDVPHDYLMEVPPATQTIDESWWNISWRHKSWQKLTKGLPASQKCDRSWWNVSLPQEKLTEIIPATQKVDKSRRNVFRRAESWHMLTEVLFTTRIFDRSSPGSADSWWKLMELLPSSQ